MYVNVGFSEHEHVNLFLQPIPSWTSQYNYSLSDQNTKVRIYNNESLRSIDLEKEAVETMNGFNLARVSEHTYVFSYRLRKIENTIMSRIVFKIFNDNSNRVATKILTVPEIYNVSYDILFSGHHMLLYGFNSAYLYSGINLDEGGIEEIDHFEFPFTYFKEQPIKFSFPYVMIGTQSNVNGMIYTCYTSKRLLGQLLFYEIWENTTNERLREQIAHILNIYNVVLLGEVEGEFLEPNADVYVVNIGQDPTLERRLITYEQLNRLKSRHLANLIQTEMEQNDDLESYNLFLDGFILENIHLYVSHRWRDYQIFRTAEYLQLSSGMQQSEDLVNRVSLNFNDILTAHEDTASIREALERMIQDYM